MHTQAKTKSSINPPPLEARNDYLNMIIYFQLLDFYVGYIVGRDYHTERSRRTLSYASSQN